MIYDIFIFLLGFIFFLVGGRYVLSIGEKGIELREDSKKRRDRYTLYRQWQFAQNNFSHNLAGYLATAGFFMMAYELHKLYTIWW